MTPPLTAVAGTVLLLLAGVCGCNSLNDATDRDIAALIRKRQRASLGAEHRADIARGSPLARPDARAFARSPDRANAEIPADFSSMAPSRGALHAASASTRPASSPASQSTRFRAATFSLVDALTYAQNARREYQAAKEDLYLAALALTLERHLWTPQFASSLRQVYGNYGEVRHFDQATRFTADLSMAQRLPFGGEFTAKALSNLIRDINQQITATEASSVELGLNVPFLRGAGHVAREPLIRLERELTYAVRDFERFRRRQLVIVASAYFDLLRSKQEVIDSQTSLATARDDFERAVAFEQAGTGSNLDSRRAQQRLLSEENRLEALRESFRAATDRFKLEIGMPVSDPIGSDDLEAIEAIEQAAARGDYPLLVRPAAVDDESRAIEVALDRRYDLLTRRNQIDDARRGVSIARNAMLPDLGWNSTLVYDTDPTRYKLGGLSQARATWRTEVVLGLPLERTRERNQLRSSMIDVHRAERNERELSERIRAEVREAVNQIQLQERLLDIQRRNVEVADLRREYARIQFRNGDIGNRDVVEAENEWTDARNRLNQAKTSRWTALLQFRQATETLIVDEPDAATNE